MNGEIDIVAPVTDLYVPTKSWYAFVDDKNRIIRTIGSLFPLTNLKCSDQGNLQVIELGHLNKQAWEILNKIIHVPYYNGLIDTQEQEIYYFKFKAYVDNSTKVEDKIHVTNNDVNITFKCLDESDINIIDTFTNNIHAKILRQTQPPKQSHHLHYVVDNTHVNGREIDINNDHLQLHLAKPGEYTLRYTYTHNMNGTDLYFERYMTLVYDR